MRRHPRARESTIYRKIARLAARQHSVVKRAQLLELGLTVAAIDHWLRAGRLHRIHRGVYAVGHPSLTWKGKWLAAVFAAGASAVLSHRSAAALLGLLPARAGAPEVIVPSWRSRLPGVRRHSGELRADERAIEAGIPVTSPARTLLDLASVASPKELRQAFRKAEADRVLTARKLAQALERRPGRRGNCAVRALLQDAGYGRGIKRSDLEADFATFLRRHGFPAPDRNVHVKVGAVEIEADCVWHEARLIVELDSRTFHDTDSAFEADRARDRALAAHGWTVIRVTYRHLHRDEVQLARDLRTILARTRG